MKTSIIAFTEKGCLLGKKISVPLEATFSAGMGEHKVKLKEWIAQAWPNSELIVFIGATGIAVRTIAPYIAHKAKDPAVIVINDTGKYCISLLSGHIGKANVYTEMIAKWIGAEPVITTATDNQHVFAIDTWAVQQGLVVMNTDRIKGISKRALQGETIDVVKETCIDVYQQETERLILVPKALSVGIGCRKNTDPDQLKIFYLETLEALNLYQEAVASIATIDVKKEEAAILQLAKDQQVPLRIFTAEQLNTVEGTFTGSDFVKKTVGTDNVCERSAVLANHGRLILHKTAKTGMTIAIAIDNVSIEAVRAEARKEH